MPVAVAVVCRLILALRLAGLLALEVEVEVVYFKSIILFKLQQLVLQTLVGEAEVAQEILQVNLHQDMKHNLEDLVL